MDTPITPHAFENLGGKQRQADARDHVLEGSAVPYPAVFMQDTAWNTFIHYQGLRPACGAHAAVHAKQILDANDGKVVKKNPRFTWIDMKKNGLDKNPSDGSDIRDVMGSLKNTGADDFEPLENNVTYGDFDYAAGHFVTPQMLSNASLDKIESYSFTDGPYTFEQLKSLIYQNKVVIGLINVGNTFWTAPNGQTSWDEKDICPIRPPSSVVSGHYVVFHSYDQNYIYFANSFGPTWGRKGHGYIGPHYPPFILELGFPKNAVPATVQDNAVVSPAAVAAVAKALPQVQQAVAHLSSDSPDVQAKAKPILESIIEMFEKMLTGH